MKTLILIFVLMQSALALGQASGASVAVGTTTPGMGLIASLFAPTPAAPSPATPGVNCVEIPVSAIGADIAQMATGNKVAGLLGLLLIICRTLSEILGNGGGLIEQRYPGLKMLAYPLKMIGWLIGKFGFGTPTTGATMPVKPSPVDPPKAA